MMKQRENSRWIKERKDSKGNLLCLVPTCNNLREKGKTNNRTRNYCKNHTFTDMWEFTSWVGLRAKALKRDNYTCVKCSDNRRDVVVTIKYKTFLNIDERTIQIIKGVPFEDLPKMKYGWREREETVNNLIADHIIPIALGGDEFDLNNVQTLCLKCNKIKTSQDMKNIAIQRRKENAH